MASNGSGFYVNLLILLTGNFYLCNGQGVTCTRVMDLVFVVDASGTVQDTDGGWAKMKEFIIDVTRRFTISQSDTRVGLTIFSDYATDRPGLPNGVGFFYLTNFTNSGDLEDAVKRLVYFGRQSNIPAGLRVARETLLEANYGDRPGVQNVVIVIVDGVTNRDIAKLPWEASVLKTEAIVYTVGVLPLVDRDELEEIATSHEFVAIASNFSDLAARVDGIVNTLCDVVTAPPPPLEICEATLDLVFVVDSSASIADIDPFGWNKVKDFVVDVTRRFEIRQSAVRVGLTIFSTYAIRFPGDRVPENTTGFFYLNAFNNANELQNAIQNLLHLKSFTNTADGLNVAWSVLLQESNGDRPNVRNAVIVITDGPSNMNMEYLPVEATNLKREALVAAVGVTPNGNLQELQMIASNQDLIFLGSDFNVLTRITDDVVRGVCNIDTTMSAPPEQTTPDAPTAKAPTFSTQTPDYAVHLTGAELTTPDAPTAKAPTFPPQTPDYAVHLIVADTTFMLKCQGNWVYNSTIHKCYNLFFSPTSLAQSEAQSECERLGGVLACPSTEKYHQAVLSLISQANKVSYNIWIGLKKVGLLSLEFLYERRTGWHWMDGSSYYYQTWGDDEPGVWENAARIQSGKWKGIGSGSTYHYFLCQKDLPQDVGITPPQASSTSDPASILSSHLTPVTRFPPQSSTKHVDDSAEEEEIEVNHVATDLQATKGNAGSRGRKKSNIGLIGAIVGSIIGIILIILIVVSILLKSGKMKLSNSCLTSKKQEQSEETYCEIYDIEVKNPRTPSAAYENVPQYLHPITTIS